jgi:hypothetical protein
MQLFVIYIGGRTSTSLIELHDICFVIAETIEDTYQELCLKWWGTKESLHLDAWGALRQADGYNITLKDYPSKAEEKLYFVNLGGYDSKEFTELHKNVFVVALNPSKAKVKALKQILDWESHHRDYQYEVEDCFVIEQISYGKKLFIHLELADKIIPFEFICKYVSMEKNNQSLPGI